MAVKAYFYEVVTIHSICNVLVCGCGTQVSEALLQHFTNTLKWWFVLWSESSVVVSIIVVSQLLLSVC